MINHETLKEYVSYDKETGHFKRIIPYGNKMKIGDLCGCINSDGYLHFRLLGKTYKNHRLAWLYVYGEWPKNQIDHINGIKTDNRICNLRDCTQYQNILNRPISKANSSGYKGVSFEKSTGKYMARARINGNKFYLGLFETAKEAGEAYINFVKEKHGDFYNEKAEELLKAA